MSRASFGKREREQAKRDKAANKRERRQRAADESASADGDAGAGAAADDGVSTADLLQMIEDVHRRHEQGEMTDDDFETTKADLLGRLRVD